MSNTTTVKVGKKDDEIVNKDFVYHQYDNRLCRVWCWEPPIQKGCVLTQQGATQIAHHKYKPGVSTRLDVLLNPLWESLTERLPLWLAPNAVTALGGLCCLSSYLVTARHNFSLLEEEGDVPNWLLVFNGVCLIVYYTLDCMDGKQARRTKSSSPLGQLFDHGVDCVANLSHMSLMQCLLRLPPQGYMWLQLSTQTGFFQAQWEEYYTGSLPHAAGNFGTTEVLYAMGFWSLLSGLVGGEMTKTVYDQVLPLQEMLQDKLPFVSLILGDGYGGGGSSSLLLVRHGFVLFWVYGFFVLSMLSMLRVVRHPGLSNQDLVGAMTKLIGPIVLLISSSCLGGIGGIRYPSLAIGLVFCSLTIKLIVFGMAHMAYASIQLEILPLVVLVILLRSQLLPSEKTTEWLFPLACLGYWMRLVWWTRAAIRQLCQRLNIQLFRIPHPAKKVD